ncbi:MAG: hypothetical protein Q9212_005467 [Teloschistes hypoglaucus]
MAACTVFSHGKAKEKNKEVVPPVQIPPLKISSPAAPPSIKIKDPFEVTKLSMQQLREHYGETRPEFARYRAAPRNQIWVLLVAAFDVTTTDAGIDEFRVPLTARTWGKDLSFWTMDLQGRRIIVKSIGSGWAVWRGINLGFQPKSIAYSDGHSRVKYCKKAAKVDQEEDDTDSDSCEDESNGGPAQAPEARVTRASVRGHHHKIQPLSTNTSQSLVVDTDNSNTRDKPLPNSVDTQARDTGANVCDRQDHTLSRLTDTPPARFTGVHVSSSQGSTRPHPIIGTQTESTGAQLLDDEGHAEPAPTNARQARFIEVDADNAQENPPSYSTTSTQTRVQDNGRERRVPVGSNPTLRQEEGQSGGAETRILRTEYKLHAALIGAKRLLIDLEIRHWTFEQRFLTTIVDGDEYIVDGFADEAGEVHHFKQWLGHELGFNQNALAVAGRKKKTAGDSSAPSASRQGQASTQSLAIVPAKAGTSISLLSEDETVEQRPWTSRTQLGKNVETPLPEHAYAGFGKRIRKINAHYLPALPPFIEVSKLIRIFLRVKVILAKPDGSYPPTDQVSESETWVTSRWWDTTCIYWNLDNRDRREIVSARLHGVRQIWRRWRDIAGGYDPVPIAYGQIRNSRRRELYHNTSSEDESASRAKPRARTATATSAAHGHEPRVPAVGTTSGNPPPEPQIFTVVTTPATEPRAAGILATANPSAPRQWHPHGTENTLTLAVKERDKIGWAVASPHEQIYLTGSNSVPLGNKERIGRLARTYPG